MDRAHIKPMAADKADRMNPLASVQARTSYRMQGCGILPLIPHLNNHGQVVAKPLTPRAMSQIWQAQHSHKTSFKPLTRYGNQQYGHYAQCQRFTTYNSWLNSQKDYLEGSFGTMKYEKNSYTILPHTKYQLEPLAGPDETARFAFEIKRSSGLNNTSSIQQTLIWDGAQAVFSHEVRLTLENFVGFLLGDEMEVHLDTWLEGSRRSAQTQRAYLQAAVLGGLICLYGSSLIPGHPWQTQLVPTPDIDKIRRTDAYQRMVTGHSPLDSPFVMILPLAGAPDHFEFWPHKRKTPNILDSQELLAELAAWMSVYGYHRIAIPHVDGLLEFVSTREDFRHNTVRWSEAQTLPTANVFPNNDTDAAEPNAFTFSPRTHVLMDHAEKEIEADYRRANEKYQSWQPVAPADSAKEWVVLP